MDIKHTIKTYVMRAGRLTDRQRAGFEQSKDFLLPLEEGIRKDLFSVQGEVIFEIGFGMGHSLIAQAQANPGSTFIGVEVYPPGVGSVLASIAEESFENLWVYREDARFVLEQCVPDHSLDRIQIFFPDPWPKKRHHKRRLIQPEVLPLFKQKLKPGGVLHIATDWAPYAEHIREVMAGAADFKLLEDDNRYAKERAATKYENRGKRLGHEVVDLCYAVIPDQRA